MTYEARSVWSAVPPKRSLTPWPAEPVGIAWHYTGAPSFGTPAHSGCLSWMRSIQAKEMSGNGPWDYSDFSYNLAVCPHGRVIEGRGLTFESGAQLGGNDTWVSVVLLVGVSDRMTSPLQSGANDARALVLARFPHATQQVGHKDVAGNPTGTVCPGEIVEAWIKAGGAGAAPPAPNTEEFDMSPEEFKMLVASTLFDLLETQNATGTKFREDLRFQIKTAIKEERNEAAAKH